MSITPTPSSCSHENDETGEGIMCSILNVIIDHSMEPPTPMEEEEFKIFNIKKVNKIKVPVIRIFGPILRDIRRGPLQTGCLYVHGVYPYLLARPECAGPDGSLTRSSPDSGALDWDNEEAVKQIADSIGSTLEASIKSLDLERNQQKEGAAAPNRAFVADEKSPLIRSVTVVRGRGFFSYCPGPSAPFLRIEYYDPKSRWKVKLMLERGLQLPMAYYPDPVQYGRNPSSSQPGPEIDQDVLKFNCYEAHIPYTMQFFKDWNLSGMDYVHIRKGKIRSCRSSCIAKYQSRAFDHEKDDRAVFLSSNTPARWKWEANDKQSQDSTFMPKKETSSDVEIDCHVQDIQNIRSVMKSMPSDDDERDKIQWRAVPSLEEIWRQERSRMARLLKPEHDFLTHPTEKHELSKGMPSLTLNVKKGAERSGARLAAKGMKSLVNLSFGLDEEFKRSLGDILRRSKAAVNKVDQQLIKKGGVKNDSDTSNDSIALTPNWNEAIAALDSLWPPSGQKRSSLDQIQPMSNSSVVSKELSTQRRYGDLPPSCDIEDVETQADRASQRSSSAQLSYPSTQHIHENAPLTLAESTAYEERLDRGDSMVGYVDRQAEDCIDPATLLPFDTLDFGEDRCRAKFVIQTDPPSTIRVCGNMLSSCQRPGHGNSPERATPGNYKTVSTGIYVDGIIDTSMVEFEEEDEQIFERQLTALATQVRQANGVGTLSVDHMDAPAAPTQFDLERYDGLTLDGIDSKPNDYISDSICSDSSSKTIANANIGQEKTTPADSSSVSPTHFDFPAWITPKSTPPVVADISKLRSEMNAIPLDTGCPSWLEHVTNYSGASRSTTALVPLGTSEYILQPVAAPPSRRRMRSWVRRDSSGQTVKRQKRDSRGRLREGDHSNHLEIDGNSRKIVVAARKSGGGLEDDSFEIHDVEEVKWDSTQQWEIPATQQPPKPPQLLYRDESSTTTSTPTRHNHATQQGAQHAGVHTPPNNSQRKSQQQFDALEGIGAQGGRIHVQGGGTLKARILRSQVDKNFVRGEIKDPETTFEDLKGNIPSPISFMSIEIHVQCRTGSSRLDSKKISMTPDSTKDKIFAIVYVYGVDPGGGESLRFLERCCLFVHFQQEMLPRQVLEKQMKAMMPQSSMGKEAPLKVECVGNEGSLLRRLSSLVRMKDPDMLLSWDTQSTGLGYLIERGLGQAAAVSTESGSAIDMVRLLGRTPSKKPEQESPIKSADNDLFITKDATGKILEVREEQKWKGSGLGSDWDERVGAGTAAASIVGRLVFAGWKIVAEEVKHPNYSYLPAITAAVLNRRIPHHDDVRLTQWYSSTQNRWRVLSHRLDQAMATLLLFDALDIIGRAGEAARLSGVEFSQSFPGIRGSQYKVEGVLLRALQSLRSDERGSKFGHKTVQNPQSSSDNSMRTESSVAMKSLTDSPWKLRRGNVVDDQDLSSRHYFFYSPSLHDTNKQEALEVQALTLEPESGHYTEPVVVCDFTALYPSLFIAYNLCYSTCFGRLDYHSTRQEMGIEGRTTGRLGPFVYPERRSATVVNHHMKSLQGLDEKDDRAYVAPTGTMYVSENVLKGVLPQVLDEILTTRAMLKRAAKLYKKHAKGLSPAVLRQLEARQLALKYVANVTYGYTSATFSGRCAFPLLADTVVDLGRKTLKKAIDMANKWGKGDKWKGAKVVYGDTDSLFVKLPGRSHKEAFDFGEELCRAVTADNPPPVQLKLEKVYMGSIMQTMKRYCGMKYESRNQAKPTFEAKGLETVRRDQCSLTQKILRNTLITLFKGGIGSVREYLCRQWAIVESGHIPVSDFILTGRVRSKYRGGKEGPVQAILAKRLGEADPGRIVRHKERIPYVIVATPGVTFRLKDCVLTPLELLERWDAYTIHTAYYIERHVNASLQRCLSLAPHYVDVNAWYQAAPTPRRRIHFWPVRSRSRAMITTYFGSDICSLCHVKCQASGSSRVVVCSACRKDQIRASSLAMRKLNALEVAASKAADECSACNRCFEDSSTFAQIEKGSNTVPSMGRVGLMKSAASSDELQLPLANCVCIDCPNTFRRHRLREQQVEASATCDVLDLL